MNEQSAPGLRRRYESWRWRVFAIAWLAYVGYYLTRRSFAVTEIELGSASGRGLSIASPAHCSWRVVCCCPGGMRSWSRVIRPGEYRDTILSTHGGYCLSGQGLSQESAVFHLLFVFDFI